MYNIANPICYVLLLSTFLLVRADLQSNVSTQILAEGGAIPRNSEDKTHLGREHVAITENNTATKVNGTVKSVKGFNVSQSINETGSKINDSINNSKIKPVIEKPVAIDAGVSKKNDEKQSVGKKGVTFTEMNSTEYVALKETTSTIRATSAPVVTKPKPVTEAPISKKPIVTKHDDFVSKDLETEKTEPDPKLSYDNLLQNTTKRANYVIPIVAVILSVPLVAIIISVLYKRGQDWWQHRNYRRMDFLIEGMYNN